MFMMAMIALTFESRDPVDLTVLSKLWRVGARVIVAIIVACLPLAHDNLSPLIMVLIVAVLTVVVLVFEVYSMLKKPKKILGMHEEVMRSMMSALVRTASPVSHDQDHPLNDVMAPAKPKDVKHEVHVAHTHRGKPHTHKKKNPASKEGQADEQHELNSVSSWIHPTKIRKHISSLFDSAARAQSDNDNEVSPHMPAAPSLST